MNRSLSEDGGAVNIEPNPILDRDCETGEGFVFVVVVVVVAPEGTTATLVLAATGAGVPRRVSRLFRYSGRALIALVLEELSSRP